MTAVTTIDWGIWLKQQPRLVKELFVTALDSLQSLGIRALAGSCVVDNSDETCSLVPLRFIANEDRSLILSMASSIKSGPPRYEIALRVSGDGTTSALRTLAESNPDVWRKCLLLGGLWISDGEDILPFIDLCQILERDSNIAFRGVFLHSDLRHTMQQGIMILGTLYRSILDELNEVKTFAPLFRKLDASLSDHGIKFHREIRP